MVLIGNNLCLFNPKTVKNKKCKSKTTNQSKQANCFDWSFFPLVKKKILKREITKI
jgi:hypothetical protein